MVDGIEPPMLFIRHVYSAFMRNASNPQVNSIDMDALLVRWMSVFSQSRRQKVAKTYRVTFRLAGLNFPAKQRIYTHILTIWYPV